MSHGKRIPGRRSRNNGAAPKNVVSEHRDRLIASNGTKASKQAIGRPKSRASGPSTTNIVYWLRKLFPTDRVVQLFVKEFKQPGDDRRRNLVGYFDDREKIAREAHQVSGYATGVFFTLNPLYREVLPIVANRLTNARRGYSAKKEHVVRRELLLIDVDPIRPDDCSATQEEKRLADEKVKQVRKFLSDRGWPLPITSDSGNGFHLIYRIDVAADDKDLIRRVLNSLSSEFTDDDVIIDDTVFDSVRLCKLPGTKSCKGNHTADRPHRFSRVLKIPKAFRIVTQDQLEDLAAELKEGDVEPRSAPQTSEWILQRARAYVEKMPEAVSGQGGHNALFAVACRLVIDFGIPVEDALPVIGEYNKRCKPPWPDAELRRKLQEADKQPGEHGSRLPSRVRVEDTRHQRRSTGRKGVFHGWVPDFAYCDAQEVFVPLPTYEQIGRFAPVFSLAVWQQQRTDAVVPDVVLRQCWWGDRPPKNWRRELTRWLGFQTMESECEAFVCPNNCPMHGSGIRHQHFQRESEKDHGLLELFADEPQTAEPEEMDDRERNDEESAAFIEENEDWDEDWEDELEIEDWDAMETEMEQAFAAATIPEQEPKRNKHRRFHIFDDDETHAKLRNEAKKIGRLLNVYWPVLILSDSPRVGLTASQQRLFLGIVRELTYSSRSRRFDRAIVIENGRVAAGRRGTAICPLLDERLRYVVFGGNGRPQYKGKGYRLLDRGWMVRAGYEKEIEDDDPWRPIAEMFADLRDLSEHFQLTVVGRLSAQKKWINLDEMRGMLSTGFGREFLENCTIRMFAPDDYHLVWRTWFSKRLGFSWIPENADDGSVTETGGNTERPSAIQDAQGLREYLRDENLTQNELAKRLGCSRERVSRNLNGRCNSQKFFQEVDQLFERENR